MRIHLIRKESIQDYVKEHAAGKSSFSKWLSVIKYADWETPEDIQSTFNSADLLGRGSNRAVFDIGGNNYRIICKYAFGNKKVHLLYAGLEHMPNTQKFVAR